MMMWTFLMQRPKLKRYLIWSAAIFIALVLFGFLALPPIVKYFAVRALEEKFHRQVVVREIAINPLNLSLRVGGFSMRERGAAEPFFSIGGLEASLGLASITEGAPVLREIKVTSPHFTIVRRADGGYSIDDIVAEILKPSDSPARYSINNIHIDDGRIEFDNRFEHVRHVVSDIHLAVPFLSNLPYEAEIYVKPAFSAKLNGAPMKLAGKIKPFSKNRESIVELEVAALDLAPYFAYLPPERDLRLPSAKLDAKLEIAFLQMPKQAPEVRLSGTAGLRDVVVTDGGGAPLVSLASLALDITSLDLARRAAVLRTVTLRQAEFHPPGGKTLVAAEEIKSSGDSLSWLGNSPVWSQQALSVSGLHLGAEGTKAPHIAVGELSLKDTAVDMRARSVTLGELRTANGSVVVTRDKAGALDLVELFRPGKAATERTAPEAGEKPWQFVLGTLALEGYALRMTDEEPDDPVQVDVEGIKIGATGLSNAKDRPAQAAVDLGFNGTGTLSASGKVTLNPLSAAFDVDLKSAKLRPFQPYFTDFLTIQLTDGSVSAKGKVLLDTATGATRLGFKGDAAINRLAAVDKEEEEDFLKWKALDLRGVDAATGPLRVGIGEVELDRFYSRLVINPDGTLNLQSVLKRKQGEPSAGTLAAPEKAPPPGYKIAIAKVILRNGQVDFSDHFIKPNYSAHLTGLGGSVTGLSSDPGRQADLALKGRVDDQGRLDVVGKINPLSGNLFLDLLASLQDFELSPLEPYSAKYAGYGIKKGKLSFDVKYRIENRKLTAENHLVLNQLTFGDKVESPTATKLPVLLAVALLKDRNGNIDVNLPVSGSLDDPEFSVGGIVIKIIVNLVVKAVTAPFALIGNLFGGGEELSYLDFDYGKAVLGKDAEGKLNAIAKALSERPGLKLDISGGVDPEQDSAGLRQQELEHKIKAQKFKELTRNTEFSGSVEDVTVAPGEYARYLGAAYRQEKIANKPRNVLGFAKDLPPAEMEKLMLASIQVDAGDLRDLANHRAQEAKEYLVNVGKIAPERIFILAPREAQSGPAKGKLSRVEFVLGAR